MSLKDKIENLAVEIELSVCDPTRPLTTAAVEHQELRAARESLLALVAKIDDRLESETRYLARRLVAMEDELLIARAELTRPPHTPVLGDTLQMREIAPGVQLRVIVIAQPEAAHQYRGYWCWCPATGRFYTSLNDELLPAQTTRIHPAEVAPRKFLEHRDAGARTLDVRDTDFYVPPELQPGSDDRREFTNRIRFCPASSPTAGDRYLYRLGSSDTLAADLRVLTEPDYRLFQDWVGNFLLCLTAAQREMRRRRLVPQEK